MTSTEKFFEKRKPAAVFKHALLDGYVTVFGAMTSTQSAGNRVWYIDGYAGPGIYDPQPGEPHQVGSPLLALATAKKLAALSSPRDLRCAFIEVKRGYAEKLRAVMAEQAFPGFTYSVHQGPVEQHLNAVVANVGDDPLLTFLDPFGTSLPWEQMKKTLFGRSRNTANEVLLNMSLDSVRRIGALLGKGDTSSLSNKKTLARLDAFLGDTGWRKLFLKHYRANSPGSATEAALEVAKDFRKRVHEEAGYKSLIVPIRKQLDHEPIFLMTLFYTHPVASYKFANAASSANEKWRKCLDEEKRRADAERHPNTLFGDDFNQQSFDDEWRRGEEQLRTNWESVIAGNIVELLKRQTEITIRDQVALIYGDTLGLAREKHLRAAWKLLAAQGTVASSPKNGLASGVIRRTMQ